VKRSSLVCLGFLIVLLVFSSFHPLAYASSTVTTQNDSPTYFQPQRKVLKSDSYYWVFFSNTTYLNYCTSADGSTWSAPTAIRTSPSGSSASFRYAKISGVEYIYYAYANNTVSNDIFFCRGTISGTTISWGTEYSIRKVTNEYEMFPDVEVASDGTVYVVSGAYYSPFTRVYTRVFKNANNDGSGAWTTSLTVTWVTSGASAEDSVVSALTALNSSMVYVITYTDRTLVARGYLYNSTWSSVETILSVVEIGKYFGIASFNNTVYFAYVNEYVRYCKVRDPTTGWGSAETISSVGGYYAGVQLCADNSNGDVYAFWGAAANITYCKRSGTWGSVTYWKTSETSLLTPSITCYPAVINNEIAVVWSKGEAGTIYLMFDLLTLSPPTLNFFGSATLNFMVAISKTVSFTWQGLSILTFATAGTYFKTNLLNLLGSAILSFTSNISNALGFNRYGTSVLTFTSNTQKTMQFDRYGEAILTFTNTGTYWRGVFLNFFGSSSLNFMVELYKTMGLSRFGDASIAFGIASEKFVSFAWYGVSSLTFVAESLRNLLRTLSFNGSANLSFLSEHLRTFTFNRYGTAPLTFTVESLTQGLGTILTFFGSASLIFTIQTTVNILGETLQNAKIFVAAAFIMATLIGIPLLILVMSRRRS